MVKLNEDGMRVGLANVGNRLHLMLIEFWKDFLRFGGGGSKVINSGVDF
jgi:hypothetical protein